LRKHLIAQNVGKGCGDQTYRSEKRVRMVVHDSKHWPFPVVGNLWSVRIGDHYRALALRDLDLVVWFWIGTHEDYNNFIRQLR
jgi:hypothetical protein